MSMDMIWGIGIGIAVSFAIRFVNIFADAVIEVIKEQKRANRS